MPALSAPPESSAEPNAFANVVDLARRAVSLPFRRGLTGTVGSLRYQLGEWWAEWSLGIDTAADRDGRLDIGRDECIPYEPLCYECLHTILDAVEPTPADVFLDYGSGLGRAVVTAATRPFGRVVGVELLPELVARGRTNLARSRRRHRCSDVSIVEADATAFRVPDDVTVVYLFNPFTGTVMSAVQDRIRESLERRPRRLRIAYMTPPDQPDLFREAAWLRLARLLPTGHWEGCRLAIYEPATEAI